MPRLPRLLHNRLSYAGTAIAVLALILFVFLFVLHSFTGAAQAPYAGLIIFIFVPAVLILGLVLVPVGMLVEWRRLRRTGVRSIPRFPIVDLNDASQRNAVAMFAVGSMLLLFLSVFGSFQAYEATESVSFCGTLCHAVMAPEFTAYENSPHARVRCVDCHVGPGADWYVKSKLSGSYQVYAVLFDKYPRPIPAPISSLRPAQQTCEQCHWPKQFFGGQQKKMVHFLPDENNTRWEINLDWPSAPRRLRDRARRLGIPASRGYRRHVATDEVRRVPHRTDAIGREPLGSRARVSGAAVCPDSLRLEALAVRMAGDAGEREVILPAAVAAVEARGGVADLAHSRAGLRGAGEAAVGFALLVGEDDVRDRPAGDLDLLPHQEKIAAAMRRVALHALPHRAGGGIIVGHLPAVAVRTGRDVAMPGAHLARGQILIVAELALSDFQVGVPIREQAGGDSVVTEGALAEGFLG